MPDGFTVDAHGLTDLALKLKRAAMEGRVEVDKTLLVVGEELASTAKTIASDHGSRAIPPTIKAEALPGAVRLTAGGAGVPIAELWEIGNRGGKRASKTFRHPVFGRDVWVQQPRYRFFAPARLLLRKHDIDALSDAWKRGLRRSGVRVD